MKRMVRCVVSIMLILLVMLPKKADMSILALYFDSVLSPSSITIAGIDVGIANLNISKGGVNYSESESSINDSLLAVNTSNLITFEVVNYGKTPVEYVLDIEFAWQGNAYEYGKLFLFPLSYSDESIYEMLANGDDSAALNSFDVMDDSEMETPEGVVMGIRVRLDESWLAGVSEHTTTLRTSGVAEYKNYAVKMFFYADMEVVAYPWEFHDKIIHLNVLVHAALMRDCDWQMRVEKSLVIRTTIDNVYPSIIALPASKVFFIDQSSEIDLSQYAVATDVFDGDITHQIEYTSYPELDLEKAGVYTITFTVRNSLGAEAAPLIIHIVIWDFIKIVNGMHHSMALSSHGRVYVWGYNAMGQLGDNTTTRSLFPKLLEGMEGIVDIAACYDSSYALNSDGQVFAWGYNGNGRLGDGTTTNRNVPVRVIQPTNVRFVDIEARFSTVGGITTEGDVYTWGDGRYGAAGTGNTASNKVPTKIALSGIKNLAMGYYNGAAVDEDGNLYTWGDNLHGQLGNGTTGGTTRPPAIVPFFYDNDIRVDSVSVGWYHMTAVSKAGELFSWGYGLQGRLASGNESNSNIPLRIALDDKVVLSMAGYYHTGVVTEGGNVYFSGQNAYGKHGTGNTTNNLVLKQPIGIQNATYVSLALESSLVLCRGRVVYGMGYNFGVLGTGNDGNSNIPVAWNFTPPIPYLKF